MELYPRQRAERSEKTGVLGRIPQETPTGSGGLAAQEKKPREFESQDSTLLSWSLGYNRANLICNKISSANGVENIRKLSFFYWYAS
jgi:hypothetical protein